MRLIGDLRKAILIGGIDLFDKRKYDQEYNRAHIRRKFIPFNDTVPEDVEMLEWLATKDNVTQYIKELIKKNMGVNGNDNLDET